MFAPRFRHPVAVICGVFLFLFQSVADAREVGCPHHSDGEQTVVHAAADSPVSHSSHHHSATAGVQAGGHAHDLASSAAELPAGEQCDCGPLCSGLVGPPPAIPEVLSRERATWSPNVLSVGAGAELLPVRRIPHILLDLPPPPTA